MIVGVVVARRRRRPSAQASRGLVVLVCCSWFWVVLVGFVGFVGGFGWFWVVLLVVLAGFGSFWVVLAGFGWFRVLVTTAEFCQSGSLAFHKYDLQGFLQGTSSGFQQFSFSYSQS